MMEKGEALDIFNGLMLGDGSLDFGGGANAYFYMSRTKTKEFYEYLLSIIEALVIIGVKVSPDQPKPSLQKSRGKVSQMLRLWSSASPILTKQYNLWIDSNNHKHRKIPDLFTKITPLALTYWFESDGSTTWTAGKLVKLELHSCQFGYEGNLTLQKLMGDIGIQMQLSRRWDRRYEKEYWGLITKNSTTVNKLLDIVESHIHPPYEYKVKRPWRKRLILDGKTAQGVFPWRDGGWVKQDI